MHSAMPGKRCLKSKIQVLTGNRATVTPATFFGLASLTFFPVLFTSRQ